MEDRMITVQEAATLAGVDPKTVRRWYREGRLTKYVTGTRRVRLSEAQVRKLIEPEPVAAGR